MPQLLLVDNGSRRAAATRALRRLAAALSERLGQPVAPVSLQHADRIAPAELDGRPAALLAPTLRQYLAAGTRDFLLVPLFFGPSQALTVQIPALCAELEREYGAVRWRLAEPLCPLPRGEPLLARILADNLRATLAQTAVTPTAIVLVDHGSPVPAVTAVRQWLAERLSQLLARPVLEAALERRPGGAYDFSGPLLAEVLERLATEPPQSNVALAMLFFSAGRHAGPDGDIATICRAIQARYPLRLVVAPLVSTHPLLIDLLAARARAAL